MTPAQQQEALQLLRLAIATIKNLKPKHSVTSLELEIETFLGSINLPASPDDDIFGLS